MPVTQSLRLKTVFLPLLAILLGACNTALPAKLPSQEAKPEAARLLLLRENSARSRLIGFDLQAGRVAYELDAGLLSADRSTFVRAASSAAGTAITRYDTRTGTPLGTPLGTQTIDGDWTLNVVSADGSHIALTHKPNERLTDVLVMKRGNDAVSHDGAYANQHAASLVGDNEIEAIGPLGKQVFLIEHIHGASQFQYAVRTYSTKTGVTELLRGRFSDEVMAGYAWGSATTANGQWLMTLYMNTNRNVAFVHLLNTGDGSTFCVNLPSDGGSFDALKAYALTYSAKHRRLYAVNPALGVVAEIDLDNWLSDEHGLHANRITLFAPDASVKSAPAQLAFSADESTLFFSGGANAWRYDMRKRVVEPPFTIDTNALGIASTAGGNGLHIVDRNAVLRTYQLLVASDSDSHVTH